MHDRYSFDLIMQGSFLRVQDWAPTHLHTSNPAWTQLTSIIQQFQHLVDKQKKQIIDCVKQLTTRRIQAIKNFYRYKTSLKVHGQIKKQSLSIYEGEKVKYFFYHDLNSVQFIIQTLAKNPKLLSRIIHEQCSKKLQNSDFAQNLLYCLYPSYMPTFISQETLNRSLYFIQSIINSWNYSIKAGRPETYTLIDQIINGFNKAPQMVCYVQKISIVFMQSINKCKMDFFAFDEQAIMHELQIKRHMAMSQNPVNAPKSRWGKLKSWFKTTSKEDEYAQSFYSQASDLSDHSQLQLTAADIMKSRQKDFVAVVKNTVQQILRLETPNLLNMMFRFFHNKISSQMGQPFSNNNFQTSCDINHTFIENSDTQSILIRQSTLTQVQIQIEKPNKSYYNEIFRHYCYFIMTNLIFQQLHSKFTISHQDTGMTPADLQNITQIIRIMTHIFQGHLPQGEKYKNTKVFGELQSLLPKIPYFYSNILRKTQHIQSCLKSGQLCNEKQQVAQIPQQTMTNGHKQQSIKQILLKMHQNTVILSFEDIRTLLHMVNNSQIFRKEIKLDIQLNFLKQKKIYQNSTKTVSYDSIKHQSEKILFVFFGSSPSLRQVAQYYSGRDNPLKNMPILTKALMYGSNLKVSQALQVTKSLQLIQNLSLKQMKYYLNKLSQRYSNLYLKENEIISQQFRITIEHHLTASIHRKANLLLHRDDICSRVDHLEKIIDFYTEELQSSQFYERISHIFIQNIKIKVYVRIQNDELQVYKAINQMKGVHLQSILMTDTDSKGKKFSDQYLLRNSFKTFSSIRDFLRCLQKNNITRSALNCGRRVQQFNQAFTKACDIIVSYIQQFMSKRELLKNLNKDRLAKTIVSNIQDHIYEKCKTQGVLQDDQILADAKKSINKYLFYQKQLQQLQVDWDFLIAEGVRKFKLMQQQTSISQRIRHFQQLFKMVFTIVGFTIPKNKISAQIINPIMQYLLLISENTRHHDCLFSLQCLKWKTSPETDYNIILYQSSLVYVSKMMAKDHPL